MGRDLQARGRVEPPSRRATRPDIRAWTVGLAACLASGCRPNPPTGDAGPDVQAPATLALAQLTAPAVTCSSARFEFDLTRGGHISGVGATDFTYLLGMVLADAGVDADGDVDAATALAPVANSCFAETSADGGTAYYAVCLDGLGASTGYVLVVRAGVADASVSSSTWFATPADCGVASPDASDAAADAASDVGPAPDVTVDVRTVDASDAADVAADRPDVRTGD